MIIFLDTETTGLSPEHDSLLEIAAVATEEDGTVIDKFHEYINPGRPIPDKIVEITHITDDQVRFCRKEWEVLNSFIEWVLGTGADTLIAHNAPFDMRFLKGRSNVRYINHPFDEYRVIDTMKMVGDGLKRGKFMTKLTPSGRKSKKQEDVAAALGIEYGEGGAHSAINDVMVLKTMFFKLENMGCSKC